MCDRLQRCDAFCSVAGDEDAFEVVRWIGVSPNDPDRMPRRMLRRRQAGIQIATANRDRTALRLEDEKAHSISICQKAASPEGGPRLRNDIAAVGVKYKAATASPNPANALRARGAPMLRESTPNGIQDANLGWNRKRGC